MSIAFEHPKAAPTTQRRVYSYIQMLVAHPAIRVTLRTLYYVAIVIGLLLLYGRGDFSTPAFIYQGF